MTHFIRASLVSAAVLMGCSQTPPPAEPELPIQIEGIENLDEAYAEDVIGSINPLENDLRGLEIAVRMRNGFRIKDEGAIFHLGVTDGAGEERLKEEFTLEETSGIESDALTEAASEGFYLRTYKLSETDHARMHAGDQLLQQLKRDYPGENQLKFNAEVRTCAEPGEALPDTYTFAVFVRSAPDVDFVALSGDVNIPKETAGVFQAAWEACGE